MSVHYSDYPRPTPIGYNHRFYNGYAVGYLLGLKKNIEPWTKPTRNIKHLESLSQPEQRLYDSFKAGYTDALNMPKPLQEQFKKNNPFNMVWKNTLEGVFQYTETPLRKLESEFIENGTLNVSVSPGNPSALLPYLELKIDPKPDSAYRDNNASIIYA
jgi:hypothetical protein